MVTTHLNNKLVNWIISPGRGKNKKYLKPPPSSLRPSLNGTPQLHWYLIGVWRGPSRFFQRFFLPSFCPSIICASVGFLGCAPGHRYVLPSAISSWFFAARFTKAKRFLQEKPLRKLNNLWNLVKFRNFLHEWMFYSTRWKMVTFNGKWLMVNLPYMEHLAWIIPCLFAEKEIEPPKLLVRKGNFPQIIEARRGNCPNFFGSGTVFSVECSQHE